MWPVVKSVVARNRVDSVAQVARRPDCNPREARHKRMDTVGMGEAVVHYVRKDCSHTRAVVVDYTHNMEDWLEAGSRFAAVRPPQRAVNTAAAVVGPAVAGVGAQHRQEVSLAVVVVGAMVAPHNCSWADRVACRQAAAADKWRRTRVVCR